jgi:hypothetical protein
MPSLARRWDRDSRRRPAPARFDLEMLEGRTLLSAAGASGAASGATVTSYTFLNTTLTTAVSGAETSFNAIVINLANDNTLSSGKVEFVATGGPRPIVLGTDNVNSQGIATLTTNLLTKLGTYSVEADYIPPNSKITKSSASVSVNVIRQPLHVPTDVVLQTSAPRAQSGQSVPLVATVENAGTGNQVHTGSVEPISGVVTFYTKSPHPIVLGQVSFDQSKTTTSSSSITAALQSIFGLSNAQSVKVGQSGGFISTNKLTAVGTYQILALFVPNNDDYTASTSAVATVKISPATRNAPTVTFLQTPTSTVESGEDIALDVTVHNASSSLAGGTVKLITVGPHPVVLGSVAVGAFDQQINFTTTGLQKPGTYQVRALYLPKSNRFGPSLSAPVTVTVTPLTAASFRVRPVVGFGQVKEPLSFTLTALDVHGQRLTNYTGTVVINSPTDSPLNLSAATYVALHIAPPSPDAPGLAQINPSSYTFTTADQGSHTFLDSVTFGKAGPESLQVIQANNSKVRGRTTFAIE